MRILPVLFGFFVMGFVDVVGIATNYVKSDFSLSDTISSLLPMMVFLWFAVFSIPTGVLMGRIGRRNTVLLSLAVTAVAMLMPLFFYDFGFVLAAFALLGIGNTMIQVSLNPMVAAIVSKEKITSVLTLGQFIKAISSFLGPVLAGAAASLWGDWRMIFAIYAVTSALSAVWLMASVGSDGKQQDNATSFSSAVALFKDRFILMLFMGIILIVGIDVGLNVTIPKLLMERCSLTLAEAGLGTSLYFSARTIGTFAGAIALARIPSDKFLKYSMIAAVISCVLLMVLDGLWAICGMIVIVGVACANVFSILFSSAIQHNSSQADAISALMIMGVAGGALVPPLMGVVSDAMGQAASMGVILLCILYIFRISFKLNNNK